MELINKGIATGKTYALIQISAKRGGTIVCHHHIEVKRVRELAKKMKVKINNPVTFQSILDKTYKGKEHKEFYIDDIDKALQRLTPVPIKVVTIRDDNILPKKYLLANKFLTEKQTKQLRKMWEKHYGS